MAGMKSCESTASDHRSRLATVSTRKSLSGGRSDGGNSKYSSPGLPKNRYSVPMLAIVVSTIADAIIFLSKVVTYGAISKSSDIISEI
jgi:hypothetical protein